MKTRAWTSCALLATTLVAGGVSAPASAQQSLGLINGVAFADANGNGKRDSGEFSVFARFKITDGGAYFQCGNTGIDNSYGVTVTPGTYYVLPIAGAGQYTSAPVIKVKIDQPGQRVVADLPIGQAPKAAAEQCGAYAPKRTARVPLGIPETATAAGFTTLAGAINTAGLLETYGGKGPFTVFAPNEAAFAKLTDVQLGFIVGDRSLLRSTLNYHVVAGKLTAADVVKAGTLKTLNGAELAVEVKDGAVYVGGAKVLATDIAAANGIVHVIDTVLVP